MVNLSRKPCVRDASGNPAPLRLRGGGIETGSPTPPDPKALGREGSRPNY